MPNEIMIAKEPAATTARLKDPLEREMAKLWKEVLNYDLKVDQEKDFLRSGGNSISLLQLQIKLRKRFDVDVSISTLAQHSSFSQMCMSIRQILDREGGDSGNVSALSRFSRQQFSHSPETNQSFGNVDH